MSKRAPFGTWKSLITSDDVTGKNVSIDDVIIDPIKSMIYHLERRPAEDGRVVLVNTRARKDVVPAGFNVRSQVQEYGGGAAIVRDGVAYVSNFADRHVYRIVEGTEPEVVTPVSEVWRYSDFSIHPSHPHLLVSILEDHTDPTPSAVVTKLCLIDTQKKSVSVLAEGADFYNAPRFSPNGSTLAWTQWNHPDMPWEGGSVHIAAVVTSRSDAGEVQVKLGSITKVAGEAGTVAANYPFWTPAGATLHFLCDQSGFANPWVWSIQGGVRPALHAPIREEFGEPAWRLGASYAASIEEDTTVLVARRGGRAVLYVLRDGVAEEIGAPYTLAYHLRRVGAGQVVFIAKTATTDAEIVLLTLGTEDKASVAASFPKFETLYTSGGDASPLKPELFSLPEAVAIEGPTGPVHTVYWPPHNPEYAGSDTDERPPCVFAAHGGPTGEHNGSLDLEIQYYTSRGWAWCEVNYGGSSGYGRAYTERLAGGWGVVDVQDMIAAASALSSGPNARVDPKRLAIRGGSSGGYTVLATLVDKDRPDVFTAGTSYYGISDLKALVEFTHKFESKYMDRLIGGSYEDIPEVFKERSPVHHADRIVAPILILQGSDDAVVPPPQSKAIVEAVQKRGGQVEYIEFEGEGHGFRKAENLKQSLESEIGFYERVFGIKV